MIGGGGSNASHPATGGGAVGAASGGAGGVGAVSVRSRAPSSPTGGTLPLPPSAAIAPPPTALAPLHAPARPAAPIVLSNVPIATRSGAATTATAPACERPSREPSRERSNSNSNPLTAATLGALAAFSSSSGGSGGGSTGTVVVDSASTAASSAATAVVAAAHVHPHQHTIPHQPSPSLPTSTVSPPSHAPPSSNDLLASWLGVSPTLDPPAPPQTLLQQAAAQQAAALAAATAGGPHVPQARVHDISGHHAPLSRAPSLLNVLGGVGGGNSTPTLAGPTAHTLSIEALWNAVPGGGGAASPAPQLSSIVSAGVAASATIVAADDPFASALPGFDPFAAATPPSHGSVGGAPASALNDPFSFPGAGR